MKLIVINDHHGRVRPVTEKDHPKFLQIDLFSPLCLSPRGEVVVALNNYTICYPYIYVQEARRLAENEIFEEGSIQ